MIKKIRGILDQMTEINSSRRHLLFLALALAFTLLFLPALIRLYSLSVSSEMYSHLVLIPLVSIYLVYLRRKEAFSVGHPGASWFLLVLAAAAVLFLAAGTITSDLSLLTASYVFFLWTGFLFFYGIISLRAVLFPLFFLVFLVPIPAQVLEWLIGILLWGSDHVSAFFFSLIGIPFMHEEYVFRLPRLSIYIAPECSGIRSSTALFLTALLADYLILSKWWSRTLLMAAVFPLAVFKNGLRIVTLSMLAIYVDPGFMSGNLHRKGGFVFFGITLLVMGLILMLLRKSEGCFGKKRT